MENQKITYKVRNWKRYNRALVERGDVTLWFGRDSLHRWFADRPGTPGRPNTYSDDCILLCLTLRFRFNLTLRASQGFTQGILSLMGLNLPVPDYSRLCRRSKNLQVNNYPGKISGPVDIVVDSTGLKVYGEGEWKMRTHGKAKRRTWRKLHLAVNPDNLEIVAMELTEPNKTDGKTLAALIEDIPRIGTAYADAAYRYRECFECIASKGGKAVVDVPDAISLAKYPTPGLEQRNRIVREIWDCGCSRKAWKKKSGYHRRSLAETGMFRFKKLLGPSLLSRKMDNQTVEARIKTMILNRMTVLGMPETAAVASG